MAVMRKPLSLAVVLVLLALAAPAQTSGPLAALAFDDGGAAGRFGSGLLFAGGASGYTLPVAGLANGFTFESWINPSSFVWSDFWRQRPDGPGNPIYTLSTTPGGAIYFSAYQGTVDDNTNYPIQTVPTLRLNTWTHVAVTYDGTQIRVYFDAIEVGRRTAHGSLVPTSQPMEIGAGFEGRIDEVRVYSRALSAAELALDRATPVDPLEPFQVSVVTPVDHESGVATTPVTATFSAAVNPATVTSGTFELRDTMDTAVAAAVGYDPSTRTATLTPGSPLAPLADYRARVVAGGVTSLTGSALAEDVVWTFRTAAAPATPRVSLAFSEGAGSVVADLSGNDNNGLLAHGAVWEAGMYGSGVRFAGGNDDVEVPARDSNSLTSAFTFEAWVKPTMYAWGDIWSQYPDDSANFLYDLAITNAGTLYTAPHLSGIDYPMVTTATLTLDAWTHVALTYDGARIRIYLDGLEVASRTAHGLLATTPEPMGIGQGFHGSIDEVRIYSRALTAGEVAIDRQTPVDVSAPFAVTTVTPQDGAAGVRATSISASFSSGVDPATLGTSTFILRDAGNVPVAADVTYNPATRTATLTPLGTLAALADYTVAISSSVSSVGGSALAGDYTWSFRTAAPASMPVAAYAFTEGTGTTTDDWSGNGNRASLVRGAAWGTGAVSGGLMLPGGNNDLLVPSSDSIALTNAFTFEAWVNPSSQSQGLLWSRNPDDTGGNPLYELWVLPMGAVYFDARLNGIDFPLMPAARLPLDDWTHLALTFDGSWLRLYLDGIEVASRTVSGSLGATNEPMDIGKGVAGRMDEVRIYRRALSPPEIAADMAMPVDTRQSVITGVTPAAGPAGQVVTIAGINFGAVQGSSSVMFAGAAAAVSAWSDTSITVVVPPDALSGPVVVTKQGVPSNAAAFTVIPRPVITGLAPAAGVVGQEIAISGSNFGSVQGAATVTFNGLAAPVSSWSSTNVVVTVPPGAASGPVVVTANGLASNGTAFTVVTPPVISAIDPASGPAGQPVTIAGANFGATQGSSTVTFNGALAATTTWTASSITATVPAAATTGPVVVTVGGYPSNGITFTVNGPRISAGVSPPPNSLGWNNSSVVVTFTCTATDSPISSCTSPQTISFSGAGIQVTGQARDQNGVTATMVVVLNVDLAGPAVSVYAPATNTVFPLGTSTVAIKGSVVDVLSGASVVTCAGAPAAVVGQNFSCTVTVQDGVNSVPVVAFDIAGRTTTRNVSPVVADIPPASLMVSPATMTLVAGDERALAVTDDRGRTVTGGSWSSSNANVAAVFLDAGVPTVHAFAAGTATATLSRDGLSAQASVTVLAADATPMDGTTLWGLTPTPNPQPGITPGVREVLHAVPTAESSNLVPVPSLFFVEHGPYFQNQDTTVLPTVVRAVAPDGREVWRYTLPPDPLFGGYSPVKQAVPDDHGGLILVQSSSRPACCYQTNEVIRRLDGLTGEVTWEFLHPETFGRFSEIALHPSGLVFVVEKLSNANTTHLVAIDGLSGGQYASYDLTAGHSTYPAVANATGPLVQDDGSVVTVVSRWDNINSPSAPRSAFRVTLEPSLLVLRSEQLRRTDGVTVNFGVGDILSGPWPDGQGGFIVGDISPLQTSGFANLAHIGQDLVTSPPNDLPFGTLAARDLQYVLSDNAGYALVQYWEGSGRTGARAFKINPASLAILDSFDLSGGPNVQLTSAVSGGGTLYTSHVLNDTFQIGYGALAGWVDAAPIVQTAATVTDAETTWPHRRGVTSRRDASNPRLGIFVKAQWVVPPIPLLHTSMRVVPKNQALWAGAPGFIQNLFGDWYLTLAAESSTGGCSGLLKSDVNRPEDLDVSNFVYRERLQYSLHDEAVIINGLLQSDFNYQDQLNYACLTTEFLNTYNSNSYTHGLLDKVGLPSPIAPFLTPYFHTGWSRPVPSVEFDPHH
jgi:Concanavalin A-like lectin/glucanases superfamily/Bacterial Ig-like domain/IPT/TIG domain